jgi:hypothetical protein
VPSPSKAQPNWGAWPSDASRQSLAHGTAADKDSGAMVGNRKRHLLQALTKHSAIRHLLKKYLCWFKDARQHFNSVSTLKCYATTFKVETGAGLLTASIILPHYNQHPGFEHQMHLGPYLGTALSAAAILPAVLGILGLLRVSFKALVDSGLDLRTCRRAPLLQPTCSVFSRDCRQKYPSFRTSMYDC